MRTSAGYEIHDLACADRASLSRAKIPSNQFAHWASLEGERWSVTAWGRNITDEEYLEEVIPAAEFGGSFIHPAATATYGADFSFRF